MVLPATESQVTDTQDAPDPEAQVDAPEQQATPEPDVTTTAPAPDAQVVTTPTASPSLPIVPGPVTPTTPPERDELQGLRQQMSAVQNLYDNMRFDKAEELLASDLVDQGRTEETAKAEASRERQQYADGEQQAQFRAQERQYLDDRFKGALRLAKETGADAEALYGSQARTYDEMRGVANQEAEIRKLKSEVASLRQDQVPSGQNFESGEGAAIDSDEEFMRHFGNSNAADYYFTEAATKRAEAIQRKNGAI
jgi:hypothetical protein